jgi:hypothetical protein
MKHDGLSVISFIILLGSIYVGGCDTMPENVRNARRIAAQAIQSEVPGDYFIGRRYYKQNFKFWGYVRRPGQPWTSSQLVMLNEKHKLAPDREQNNIGNDNNCEYVLYGYFSGDRVYEPASNRIYPEFVLKDYKLVSVRPAPIFRSQYDNRAGTFTDTIIEKPE